MPAKKQINSKKLIKAVESKRPSREIMDEFGIKTQAQLKSLYVDALVDQNRITAIVSSRGRKEIRRPEKGKPPDQQAGQSDRSPGTRGTNGFQIGIPLA